MSRLARLAPALTFASGVTLVLWWRRWLGQRPEPTHAGGLFRIVRCGIHGFAYDSELEACPECARGRGTSACLS